MEDQELKLIWGNYNQQLNESKVLNLQSWAVNLKTFAYLQKHRSQSKLSSLARFKRRAVVLGFVWIALLGLLVYGNQLANLYFAVSLGMIALFTAIAIVVYIKHNLLIQKINYTESIAEAQQKLTKLQTSTIEVIRILWLQLPFYTTFFWSADWIKHDITFWFTAFPITLAAVILSLWLFRNISVKNAEKKWFRVLLGKEWKDVVYAKEYLQELEEFTDDR